MDYLDKLLEDSSKNGLDSQIKQVITPKSHAALPEHELTSGKVAVSNGEIPQEVFDNLLRLEESVKTSLPEAANILEHIHAQLVNIPEVRHLLTDDQVDLIIQSFISCTGAKITPEVKKKKESTKVATMAKAGKNVDVGKLSADDF